MARAAAIDTPVVAFAPRRLLLGVPSRRTSASSSADSESTSHPTNASRISPSTFMTARCTPAPP